MRRKISKKKLAIFLGLLLSILVIHALYQWKILCSNSSIQKTIDKMCDHFANGKAHGNLCRHFCVTGSITPQSCQTFHMGKEVVFSANYENQPVFVKGRRMDFMEHPEEALHWSNQVFPSTNDFQMMVKSYLQHNMGLHLPENTNLMEKLWFTKELSSNALHPDVRNWERANLWSLIQDNEYVLSKFYSATDVFPTLMGSCGGFFVVEALEPVAFPHYFSKLAFKEWAQRVAVALAILDFLDELETVFDDPVHLCDVKPDHFGISESGRVKFLDLDSVFLKPYLDKTMTHNVSCTKHSECDFFDCKGQCDLIDNQCTKGVVNNNLQVICEKILLTRTSGLPVSFPGLLWSKHLNKRIKRLLESCANPSGSKTNIRIEASSEIRTELYKALREVMDIARQVDTDETDLHHLDRDDM